ncbi:MAG TPA: hypothetical protein VHF22_03950 [Planctomycetota bacterium]|nr:hypothetical protein [Planctomycetota bacterium]
MPNKKLWAYIAKLEKVIKSTMESSSEISELVEKIQREGVEVSLNCIALFSDPNGRSFTGPSGSSSAMEEAARKLRNLQKGKTPAKGGKKKPGTPKGKKPVAGKGSKKAKPEFKVTDADREFLKNIGIRFD